MGKELFSEELKLAVVQYVLEGHTRKEASEKFCVSCTPIEKWVNLYKLYGVKGLMSRNDTGRQKGFDGEFRLKVLQYKQEHRLSCTQTPMHFCLDVVTVCWWEKKFQKGGAQGLMMKRPAKGTEKRQKKQEQTALQQENKRLSEENYQISCFSQPQQIVGGHAVKLRQLGKGIVADILEVVRFIAAQCRLGKLCLLRKLFQRQPTLHTQVF